ncbi:MAG TPA: S1 family peptidase [Egicoccus sp.]|nr:S1 family peptidase [Egicoccus sp.]HSK24955.1 S1 family peptidase [Egicoccus sp.]
MRHTNRSALLAAILSLSLGLAATTAAAEPATRPAAPRASAALLVGGPHLPDAARVDAAEAAAVGGLHGLPAPVGRRLVVHHREVNDLYAELLADPPPGFAGLWMDEETAGEVVVAATGSASANAAASRVAGRLSLPDTVTTRVVEASRNELETLRRRIERDAETGGLASPVLGTYVDEPSNFVVVNVPATTTDEDLAAMSRSYGRVRFEPIATMTDDAIPAVKADGTCQAVPTQCNPLRGGAVIGSCTIGFIAKNAAGTRRVISAGHCSNTNFNHNGTAIGSLVAERYGGSVDAQTVSINSGWQSRNWVINGAGNQKYAITSVSANTNLATGTALCRYGKTSFLSCGKVKNGSWSGTFDNVSGWTNMLLTDNCAEGGDSGGPYFADNRAHSVHKGTSRNLLGGCSWAISSYVKNVQTALSVTILTAP